MEQHSNPKKYNEFELIKIRGKEEKHLTERGHVSIDSRTAEINNRQTKYTKLVYELAEDDNSERDLLFKEAETLGLKINARTGIVKLKEKLAEFRTTLITEADELELAYADEITNVELQKLIKDKLEE